MIKLKKVSYKGIAKKAFKYTTASLVVVYFVLSLLYTLPINPVKISWNRLINVTIGSYFSQNWSLFAPNPISSNKNLLIYPLTDSTFQPSVADQPIEWIDITQPLADNFHLNRLSAYERLGRVQREAFHMYLGYNPYLYIWQRACTNGDSLACTYYTAQYEYDKKVATDMFKRIGSSVCNQLFEGKRYTHFLLAYKITYPVEWSKRYAGTEPASEVRFIGTFQIDRSIEKSRFFEHDK